MGSKVSFGRGSSDQNAVSELTPVAPHPPSPIHEPSDCNQIHEDKRCTEDDLESRWGAEMKATELNRPASQSRLPGNEVNSETAGGENGRHSEQHTLSSVGAEEKSLTASASVCSSVSDSHGKPEDLHGGRRRPRKVKRLTAKEVGITLPLPTSLENHDTDKLPDVIDKNSIDNSLHWKDCDPPVVSTDKVESGDFLVPKKKRGRPKKGEKPAFPNTIPTAAASVPAASPPSVNNANVPIRTLRRKQLNSIQDENSESHSNADSQQAQLASKESNNTSDCQAVRRRRRRWPVDDQVPEKISKLDDSQEAVSLLMNNTDCAVTAKTDQQKGPDDDKPEGDANGNEVQIFTQPREEQEQQSKEHASPQRMSPSHLEPGAASSDGLSNLNTMSVLTVQSEKNMPENTNGSKESQSETPESCDSRVREERQKATASDPGVTPTSEETQKPVDTLLTPKEEDVEIELDSLNPASQDQGSVQNGANPTVEAEHLPEQRNIFRRKRGGKRRRRITVRAVVPKEVKIPKEDHEASHEGSWNGEQKTDLDGGEENVENKANLDGDPKVIYVKKGGKTHLKCGYCGRIFKFHSQFIIHQRIHTGERPYKCPECGKGFSKNSNLNLHLKTHRKSNIYQKCPFCSIKFSYPEYTAHMEMHAQEFVHEYKNENPENPNIGSNLNNTQELEKTHEKRERKVCQYCGKSFQFQSALVRHVRVHTGEKPYKCDICGKAFGQAYFLRVHELTHWSVKRYNCTRCEKSFTHYSNAKNHTCRPVADHETQHNTCLKPSLTYTCHICKNVFDHLQEFNSHMRDHAGAKLYRCLYCDKLFGVLSEFTAHHNVCKVDRSNSDIKQETTVSLIQYTVPTLRCSVVNSSAPVPPTDCDSVKKESPTCHRRRTSDTSRPFQSTVIRAHPLSHLVSKLNKLDTRSDPRKYLCPACGRLFRHMGRLRAHMLTHSPHQSYTCACCGKTLGNWKKLWHHQRVHRQRQGRFSCPQCGQGFRFIEPYRKHMREHSEFKWVEVRPKKVSLPYQCELCSCSFKTLDFLFAHELCHASPSEVCRDSDFELSVEEQSTHSSTKTQSLPTNSTTLILHTVQVQKNSSINFAAQHPSVAAQQPSTTPNLSIVHDQSLNLANSSRQPSLLVQGSEVDWDRTNDHAYVRTMKKPLVQNVTKYKGGSSDGVQCAVCGNSYSAISDLYQHYLQHARGQV